MLRALVGVNILALLAALVRNRRPSDLGAELVDLAAAVEPVAIAALLALYLAGPLLRRRAYDFGVLAVLVIVAIVAGAWGTLFAPLATIADLRPAGPEGVMWALLAVAILLGYFRLQSLARSPALAEARLMALTARIRPHFLFNSLNAVLGVIRSDPRRAEAALEELADLFRALMRDNRELVPLSDEIALARQYLDLERLRLGDRLKLRWEVESCPPDALVPPLMLQPLLENAVYHGIEPQGEQGEIRISLARAGDRIRVQLSNPFSESHAHHQGNRMALANIRERLLLYFDLEATMTTTAEGGSYVVRIEIPYRKEEVP
ncbi:MAG: sensor histidine kinase [Rhodocyclaceae bacterium]|nr:sensor histidine kinase [Rhodocyclaceae bacterium]